MRTLLPSYRPFPYPSSWPRQIVYRRFASLFFAVATDMADNELATLDLISQFVEILDRYFGNVCEVRASVIDDHLSMHVCLT